MEAKKYIFLLRVFQYYFLHIGFHPSGFIFVYIMERELIFIRIINWPLSFPH